LKEKLERAGEDAAVVFLGDLLPCCGMPLVSDPAREDAERRLLDLIEAVRGFPGRVVFIPGDHDWGRDGIAGDGGWRALLRMEAFIEEELGRGNVFRPDDGFPGPDEIQLTRDIRLVALNTQWMLTEGGRATGDFGDMEVREVYSNGRFGGDYHPKGHLFPLTLGWQGAYVPLPIIGTMVMAIAGNSGDEQYLSHTQNRWMRETLDRALLNHEDFVYLSAQDYSMQHFWTRKLNRSQHYLVSGSAARSEWTSTANRALFASSERGLMSLSYYEDGSIWADAWAMVDGGAEQIYEASLRDPKVLEEEPIAAAETVDPVDYRDSSKTLAAEPEYEAGWLQRLLLGSNLRDVWTTPVEVPYIDIASEHGGLTPIKRGGGMQSISVRLEAESEKQYVLRSVNKDGRRFLPPEIQYTFVAPISQDFLSYSHPYGALIIPPLADAVGVYHTNPRLVWVPDDPRLGEYRDLVGNMLMLYEERPTKDMSDAKSFGNSDDVVGSFEMFRNVTRDNDYSVNGRSLARARLFDMWLSDWDRHKDQWRWASFEASDARGRVYEPIPRDRDQAFNKLNFLGHNLLKPYIKFQSFDKSYRNIQGLNMNARNLDHRFLSSLDFADFQSITDSVVAALTDDVIEGAMRQWPEPVFAVNGQEMIETGRIRRDKLSEVAEKFYRMHARSVDVVGSNKHERFEVTRLNADDTEVVVYKTNAEGEVREEIYRRVMNRRETKEIVLYGLDGADQFVIRGASGGIKVHAMGGTGIDTFVDESTGEGIVFHDSRGENHIRPAPRTSVKLSDDPERNDYTGFFEFPQTYPVALAYYTTDDGLVVLGGAADIRHSFRKDPYAKRQVVSGSYATSTNALGLSYTGSFKQTYGWWDQGVALQLENDNNFHSFYGLGNETGSEAPLDTFRIRVGGGDLRLPIERTFEPGVSLSIAPLLRLTNVRDDQERLLGMDQPGLSEPTLDPQWYAGAHLTLDFVSQDEMTNPRHGFGWPSTLSGYTGLHNAPDDYATLETAIVSYVSLRTRRQVTLALRVGGAHNFGIFPFYGANTIGSNGSVRGYRSDRFSGRSSLYGNAELRLELFRAGGVLVPGAVGLNGFFDVGRVWTDGESSREWHPGYGGGIWYDFSGELVLRLEVGFSKEDTTVLFGPGFFF
jgi:hypothetical protein